MRRFALATLACPVFLLFGCDHPITDEFHIEFVGLSPLEVDTVPNDTNGDGLLTGYIAEEVSVSLRLDYQPNLSSNQQRRVTITNYVVEYEVMLPDSGGITPYENGIAMHLAAGEQGEFAIRAVSFKQKDQVRNTFGADATVNVRATVTLYGTTDDGEEFELVGYMDLIFADFAEPKE